MKSSRVMGGISLAVIAGGIWLLPGMQGTSVAQEISGECAALVNTPSVGPAPAGLVERCAAERKLSGSPAPLASPVGSDNVAFGVSAFGGPHAYDLVSLPLNDANNLKLLGEVTAADLPQGCDFDNSGFFEKLYCVNMNSPADFYTVNTVDGTVSVLGQATTAGGEFFTGLSTDPASGVMYAVATTCGASSLYKVNPLTGATSLVGPVTNGQCMINLGASNDGVLYGVDIVTDNLIRIDKTTGAGTIVGPIGFNANFAQGMDFDEKTGTCYLFAYNMDSATPNELRTCDTATGNTTPVGIFGSGIMEITGAGISRFGWPKFRPATSGVRP